MQNLIKSHWLIILLFFVSGFVPLTLIGQPPGDEIDMVHTVAEEDEIANNPCLDDITLTGSYFDENIERDIILLNLDCPENSLFSINLPHPKPGCSCSSYSISFGGQYFYVNSWMSSNNLLPGNYQFNLPVNVKTRGSTSIVVSCWPFLSNSTKVFDIQTISNGGEYSVFQGSDGNGYGESTELLQFPDVCCCTGQCPTSNICFSNGKVKITSTSSQSEIEISGTIGFKGFGIGVTVPYSTFSPTTLTNQISQGTSEERCLPVPPLGSCIKVCVRPIWKWGLYKKYIARCGQPDLDLGTERKIIPESVSFQLINCEAPYPISQNDCPALKVKARKKSNLQDNENCIGGLYAEIISGSDLYFEWTGPNGFYSQEPEIYNVPYGNYTLTVVDKCCNVVTSSINLCDETITGPWVQQNSGEWCRDVQCKCDEGPALRSGDLFYSECVTPDNIKETYVSITKQCKKEYFYDGEFLGEVITLASHTTNYDAQSRTCMKIYTCGNASEAISENANYGFWSYNNITNLCERSIICFNEVVPDVLDTERPEIVFQNLTSLCVANCDNSPSSYFFPVNPGFWRWNQIQGCTKDVTCIATDGPITVNGTASYHNWTFNNFTNMCNSDVSCDNNIIFGTVNAVFPQLLGQWSYNNSLPQTQQCSRDVLCNGNYIVDYATPTYQPLFTCTCENGTATSYNILCGTQVVDHIPCPPPSDCFDDGENTENRNFSKEQITFYPNPSSDHIIFEGLNKKLDYYLNIKSNDGSDVLNMKLLSNQIDVSELSSSLYFITIIHNGNIVFASKFLKI